MKMLSRTEMIRPICIGCSREVDGAHVSGAAALSFAFVTCCAVCVGPGDLKPSGGAILNAAAGERPPPQLVPA